MNYRVISTLAVIAGFALAGCDDDSPTQPPPPGEATIWVSQLTPEGDFELSGSATAESSDDESVVTIEAENGSEGTVFHWYVGTGAECGELELRLGSAEDYPELEANGDGEASAEATLDEALDPEEEYHVALLLPGEEEGEYTLVACGELTPED